MNRKTKKLLTAVAAVLTVCLLLTSCSSKSGKASADDFTAKTPVFECAGVQINYDEYMYVLNSYKATYEGYYGPDYWNTTDGEAMSVYIRSYAESYLKETCGLLFWAQELGVQLEEEDEATVAEQYQTALANYESEEAMLEAMKTAGMTKDLYMDLIRENVLINKLYLNVSENQLHYTDEDLEAYGEEKNLIRIQHILIKNDEGDDPEENLALAKELQQRAAAGEDFTELVQSYSEDAPANMESGYTFSKDDTSGYVKAFADAAVALAMGEISDVVEVNEEGYYSGYHILKRVELDLIALQEDYLRDQFYALYDKAMDGRLEVTYLNGIENVPFTDLTFKFE